MLTKTEGYTLAIIVGLLLAVWFAYEHITGAVSDDLSGALGASGGPSTSGSGGGLPSSILGALKTFENVASFHNNPGAICGGYDAAGNCTGPKTYASLSDGVAAAEANISRYLTKNPNMTVSQFVTKWSGAKGQVLTNYINHVKDDLGLEADDPIADAEGGDDAGGGDGGDDYLGGDDGE